MPENIVPHNFKVSKQDRNILNGHGSFVVWFTGLSGSGKSTIANGLEQKLHQQGIKTYVLDGDNTRAGINKDLSFSAEDRSENIRRIAEIANLMVDAGLVVISAFVSPYKKDREYVQLTVKPDNFVEVFVNTSLEACEARDVKGLYAKARKGEITNMTGITDPYEAPENPDLELTEHDTINQAVDKVYKAIYHKLQLIQP